MGNKPKPKSASTSNKTRKEINNATLLFTRSRVGGCFQGADGDDAEAFAVGCGEDLWEGLDGAGWVGDAVVEDDDGAGG